jgi:hypothetical protein
MVSSSFSSSCSMRGATVLGRSISSPLVIIGALTMKMISNTSMTSTNGVTLISLTGPLPPPELIPMELPTG